MSDKVFTDRTTEERRTIAIKGDNQWKEKIQLFNW